MPPAETVPAEVEQNTPHPDISQQSSFEAMVAEKGAQPEPAAEDTEGETADPQKKKPTAEEVDEATRLMAERLGFGKPKKKDKTDADDKSKSTVPDKKPAGSTAPPPPEKKVAVRKRAPAADPEEVAALAATTAAKTVAQSLEHLKPAREPKADPNAEIEASLTDEEKEEYAVFKHMAELSDTHKQLPGLYLDQIRKINDYQRRWEAENPGKRFDANDEEHDSFYEAVTPRYNPKEFEQAKIDMAVDRRLAKTEAKREKERTEDRAEIAIKEIEPVIVQSKLQAVQQVLTAINPDLDKIVQEKGWDAFVETDDTAARILSIAGARLGPFIEAARQIDEPRSRIPIDEKNEAHVDYVNYLIAQEEAVKGGPASERVRDGKRFATRRELSAMSKAQRAGYWFLDDTELIARRVAEEAELAKAAYEKEIARIEKLAEKRGYKKVGGRQTDHTQQRQTAPAPNKNGAEQRSPESLGSATNDTSGSTDLIPVDKTMDSINKVLFGR